MAVDPPVGMAEDGDRIERLEREVERLRERVDDQYELIALLAAQADSDALPTMDCPYCEEGVLFTDSGITWRQVGCTECEFLEYV